jgi:hypothetical protein
MGQIRSSSGRLRAWLELFRISNLPTVWTNVSAAWWLSGAVDELSLGELIAGTSFVYVGGMALNDAFDSQIDRRERPERPIPSGRLLRRSAWIAGFSGMIAGCALAVIAGADIRLVTLLAAAVLAYDWLHKRSPLTAGLMALCRAILWWLPATLPGHHFTTPVLAWSAVLFAYIAGVTLLARGEGCRAAGLQQNATVWFARLLLFTPAAAAVFFSDLLRNWPTLLFIALVVNGLRSISLKEARSVSRLLATVPIIDAMAVAPAPFALLLTAGFPLCLLLQRSIVAS